MPVPSFLRERPDDIHSTRPWAPFRVVNLHLESMLGGLLAAGADADAPPTSALDFGCGIGPYRAMLSPGCSYTGVDLPGNPTADLVLTDTGGIPAADGTFDLVLSTQVLEHVRDPAAYLAEARRVLRPGGRLVLSTHGAMYYHRDPEDYWRWTSAGLAAVVEDAGFVVIQQAAALNAPAAALQMLQDTTRWRFRGVSRPVYTWCMQKAVARLQRTDPGALDGLVIGLTGLVSAP